MKLDKRHLIASLALLVGSIVYNVWVFTRPAAGTAPMAVPQAFQAPGGGAGDPAAGQSVLDPSQITALPDVALDRLPQWPRNPFVDLRARPELVEEALPPAPVDDPDPVVATILYSAARRGAIVGGRIVREGDRIGSLTVVDILPDGVVVESPVGGRRTLRLRSPGAGVLP